MCMAELYNAYRCMMQESHVYKCIYADIVGRFMFQVLSAHY